MLTFRWLAAGCTVVLLVATAAAPALAACAGWSSSTADRHACCAHLGSLAAEATVTNCCAMAEQSNGPADRGTSLSPIAKIARPVPSASSIVVLASSPGARPVFPLDRFLTQQASPPKYVLLASFLI
ncbi:MAG: hypothetical protein HYY76_03530 [Acidobacteria bacterium]|nr:hypothetical protein [Acidobacteriota bacterium]